MSSVLRHDDPVKIAGDFIRTLRTTSPDMPMQQADVLLAIAAKPGLTMNELSKLTGLSQSSISRNVSAMSKYHRLGKEGLNLVEAVTDPRETRRRLVYLTPHGKMFITKLLRTLDADYSMDKDTDARLDVERIHQEALEKEEATKTGRGRAKPPAK